MTLLFKFYFHPILVYLKQIMMISLYTFCMPSRVSAWRNYLLRQSKHVHALTDLYMCLVHTVSCNRYSWNSVIFSVSVTILSGTYGDFQEVKHKVYEEVLTYRAKATAHTYVFICRLRMPKANLHDWNTQNFISLIGCIPSCNVNKLEQTSSPWHNFYF